MQIVITLASSIGSQHRRSCNKLSTMALNWDNVMTDQTDWRVQLQMQIVCCTDSGCTSVMFSNTIMKITIQTLHLSWRITFFLAYHKLKIWQRNRQRWKVLSINMKAICQALIIFLILQSVKGSQGKENSKWPFTSWKKTSLFFRKFGIAHHLFFMSSSFGFGHASTG